MVSDLASIVVPPRDPCKRIVALAGVKKIPPSIKVFFFAIGAFLRLLRNSCATVCPVSERLRSHPEDPCDAPLISIP